MSLSHFKNFLLISLVFYGGSVDAQTFTNVAYANNIFHQYSGGLYGGGVSFCDFDNDGLDDLTFANKSAPPSFFRNTGSTFESYFPSIQNDSEVKQINWIDYDNDGDRDLFFCNLDGPVKLYNNDGNMNLTDVTLAAGFPVTDYETYGNSWADYDRDGDIDVYISNYNGPGFGDPTIQNFLYRNNGDGTFSDVTTIAGVGNGSTYTFQGIWMDHNEDLWPDLFVVNDRYENANNLYLNNGDGTFSDISVTSGLSDYIFAMGVSISDYDHDNDLDFYITNGTDGNVLKRNNGNGTYSNASNPAGVALNLFCWGTQFIDYDNDTWDDLFVCSTPFMATNGQNKLLKNNSGVFTNVTAQSGVQSELAFSYSNAMGDLNQDGFADLAVLNGGSNFSSVWLNNIETNNWLTADLTGTTSNIDGISSWIYCYAGGQKFIKYTHCGESYLGQNSFTEFFGMSDNIQADSIQVKWPSGIVDTWYNVPVNQHLQLVEGQGRRAELVVVGELEICSGETNIVNTGLWSAYSWSNSSLGNEIEVTASESIHCLVTDEYGNNFLSDTISIEVHPLPLTVAETIDPLCFNETNGAITIIPAEENLADFEEIIWTESELSGFIIEGLGAGFYEYQVYSSNNCVSTGSVILIEPNELLADLEINSVSCHGMNDGNIILQLYGGSLPYSIDWNFQNPDSLAAGQYSVIATDDNGCSISNQFIITQPDELTINFISTPHIIDGSPGTASLTIMGGTTPYSINWSTGEENVMELNDLKAGTHSVIITDAAECVYTHQFEIELVNSIGTQLENGINIFPNPANDVIYLTSNHPTVAYQIFDCSGRQILSGKLSGTQNIIQTSNLKAGMYFIQLNGIDQTFRSSFIIN